MRTIASLRMLLVVVVATVAADRAAAAAEPAQSDAGIEDQISQGVAMRRVGKDEAALGIFLDLEKRAPDSVRLLLHIATAALALGKWTMAYDYMQRASVHKDDPYYQRHKAAIENVERTIAQRVGQFRAHGSPAGAEVRLSGEVIGTLPMGDAKVVEVGSYTLEVSKAGYFPLRRPITIASDGSLTQEDVDLREQKPFQLSVGPGGQVVSPGVPLADAGPPQTGLRARWVTWTLAGVAVAAAATSGVAFAIREQKVNQWNSDSCLSRTTPTLTRDEVCGGTRRDVELAQGIGIGAGIGAVALGGAALIHWLATTRGGHPVEGTGAAAALGQAGCSPGLGSVVCSGSF